MVIDAGEEKATYFAGLTLMLEFLGTNFIIKIIILSEFFVIFYFFIGNIDSLFKISQLSTFLLCFLLIGYRVY
jgi:hypothetical protein